MSRFLVVLALLIGLSGCAITPHRFNPNELAPSPGDRVLSAIVMYDSGFNRVECSETIQDVSQWMQGHFGISIQPIEWIAHEWKHNDIDHLLGEEWRQVDGRYDFDVVIGFYSEPASYTVLGNIMGNWKAVIDDRFRRYIVLKSTDWYDLAHEMGHAFMLSHTHDWTGLMAGMQHGVPFIPLYLRSAHVSENLRVEVTANKWRDFSLEVNLGEDRPETN